MFGQIEDNLKEIAESCFLSDVSLDSDDTFKWQAPAVSSQDQQPDQNIEEYDPTNSIINSLRSKLDILLKELDNAPQTPQIDFLKVLIFNDIDTFNNAIDNKMGLLNTAINLAQNINAANNTSTVTNQVDLQEPMIISVPMNQL